MLLSFHWSLTGSGKNVQYLFELNNLLLSSFLIFFLKCLVYSFFPLEGDYDCFDLISAKLSILNSWSPNLWGLTRYY